MLNTMVGRVKGKIALVTGAAQGIGKEIAHLLHQEGATVILSDIKNLPATPYPRALSLHLDVRSEENWQAVMQTIIERFGRLDILINNAGITGFEGNLGPQDPEHASLESWKEVNAVNTEGVFLGCKYALKVMKKSGGSIVNISSRSGLVGIPGAAAYAASKAAVRNHTKSVALYACDKGYPIRCNSIHPAAILTPMWETMLGQGPDRKKNIALIEEGIPMKKMGTPSDVAYAAVFLASDEAKYITGTELTIDGGILAGAGAPPAKAEIK